MCDHAIFQYTHWVKFALAGESPPVRASFAPQETTWPEFWLGHDPTDPTGFTVPDATWDC